MVKSSIEQYNENLDHYRYHLRLIRSHSSFLLNAKKSKLDNWHGAKGVYVIDLNSETMQDLQTRLLNPHLMNVTTPGQDGVLITNLQKSHDYITTLQQLWTLSKHK